MGGVGHGVRRCDSSGKSEGERMSFIQFLAALFGIDSASGAGINPNG